MNKQKFICNCIFRFKTGEWTDDWEPGGEHPPCQIRIRAMVMAILEGGYIDNEKDKDVVKRILGEAPTDVLVTVKTYADGFYQIYTDEGEEAMSNGSDTENTVVCRTADEFMLLATVRVDTDRHQYFTNGFDWWFFNGRNPNMVDAARRMGYRRPTLSELREIARNGYTVSDLKERWLHNPQRRTGEEDYKVANIVQSLFEQAGDWVGVNIPISGPDRVVEKVIKRMKSEYGIDVEVNPDGIFSHIRIKPEDINFID